MQKVIKSSFLANGITVSDPFCHELYSHYSSSDAYSLHSDVQLCLQRLQAAKTVMGIISDFDERLAGILSGLGIGTYFQFIVQSYVEGHSKPSHELWQVALERAGQVERGWHVGDDPKKDAFEDAVPIILDRQGTIETLFTRIRTLDELPSLLDIE
jgi:putative hydrolase of the HAD superfamily